MALPPDHPLRGVLNDEVHARPPELLSAPVRVSFLALLSDWGAREEERAHVARLARHFGAPPPAPDAVHYSADLGPVRFKWERHTEFARYKFIAAGEVADPFAEPAIAALPADWVAALPGTVIVALHAVLVAGESDPAADLAAAGDKWFGGEVAAGASIAEQRGMALTDFRIRPDGFSRLWIADRGMTPRLAGLMLQRLVEIEAYRMLALLAFPVAKELAPALTRCERELTHITDALAHAKSADEPGLLDRLTGLQAEIESLEAQNHYRFGAAVAYYDLVRRRIAELREERVPGCQMFQEFMERRLAPAMSTCSAVSARQAALSERVSRAAQMLSARVDLTRERQNQHLLETMNRRALMQLRMQETVEWLSVAAVTYYVVGLVGYLAEGAHALGVAADSHMAKAFSIPVVALLVALGLRRVRTIVAGSAG